MNPAISDGCAVLGQAQDEQPHVVLLSPSEAEPEAPRASLQLHGVAAKALSERKHEQNQLGCSPRHDRGQPLGRGEVTGTLRTQSYSLGKECTFG